MPSSDSWIVTLWRRLGSAAVASSPSWRATFRLAVLVGVFAASSQAFGVQLALSWADNSDNETGFEIERSMDGVTFTLYATVGENVNTYVDEGVSADVEYWYRVRAYNSDGKSGYTNVASGMALSPNTAPTVSAIGDVTVEENRASSPIAFAIGDAETAADQLALSASSSNQTLIPNSSISLSGSGSERSLTFTPASGQTGTATITVQVSDGEASVTESFVATVDPNAPPSLGSLQDVSAAVGTTLDPIAITLSDADTPLSELLVTVTSSNQTLVANSGITVSGSGGTRELTIVPQAGVAGSTVIVVRVSDGVDEITDGFSLTLSEPSGPSISGLQDVSAVLGEDIPPMAFTVSDPDTDVDSLTITANSKNKSLQRNIFIDISTTGSTRALTLSPEAGETGTAVIEVTVSDGTRQATSAFTLTVSSGNEGPQIETQPSSVDVLEGGEAFFSVTVTGTPAPTLQWYKNGESIAGATEALFGIGQVSLADAGIYHVVATNEEGSVASVEVELFVEADVSIIESPSDLELNAVGQTILSVQAAGPNLTYQWYAGESGDTSNPVDGATEPTFETPELSENAKYWVRVTSEGGRVLSAGTSADSDTADIVFNPIERIYFGDLGEPAAGSFAMALKPDGTGIFMGNLDTGEGAYAHFAYDAQGQFAFDGGQLGTISGQVRGELLEGTFGGGSPLAGVMDLTGGSTANYAGSYETRLLYQSDGTLRMLVGPDGSAYVQVEQEGEFAGAEALVGEDGMLSGSVEGVALVEGSVANPEKVTAQLTVAETGEQYLARGLRDDQPAREQLSNTSIRTFVREGASTMIAGFVVRGDVETKRMLIRGLGPALLDLGVPGSVGDPRIELFRRVAGGSPTLYATNDDWSAADNAADVVSVSAAIGAAPLKDGSGDAVLLLDLPKGVYSAHITDSGGNVGPAMVELFDADLMDTNDPGNKILNLSMRGEAGTGDNVIIAGFVVNGNAPKRVLVRAVGAELAAQGVPGALSDPALRLFRSKLGVHSVVAENDDWGDKPVVTEASASVGAFPLDSGSSTAAMVLWLEPGVYSAHAYSADGSTGITLVEVYALAEE